LLTLLAAMFQKEIGSNEAERAPISFFTKDFVKVPQNESLFQLF